MWEGLGLSVLSVGHCLALSRESFGFVFWWVHGGVWMLGGRMLAYLVHFVCCVCIYQYLVMVLSFPFTDSCCLVVVLCIKRSWVFGYSVFYPEEEKQPGFFPSRVPSLYHVHIVVDWNQVGGRGPRWGTRLPDWKTQIGEVRLPNGSVSLLSWLIVSSHVHLT